MSVHSDRHKADMEDFAVLSRLACGQQAVVAGMSLQAEERCRLRELGINDGVRIECVLRRRGIGAYLIRGTVIALRDSESSAIHIQPLSDYLSGSERGCAVCP